MQTWYPFKSGCPGDGCNNSELNINWVHRDNNCNGPQEINVDADIRCTKCHIVANIMACVFSCKDHSDEYRTPDIIRLTWALSVSLVVAAERHNQAWASRFQRTLLRLAEQQQEEEDDYEQAGDYEFGREEEFQQDQEDFY